MGFLYFVISFCHSLLPEDAETDHYCGSVSVGALELVHFLLSLSHSYDLYFLRAKLKYGMANNFSSRRSFELIFQIIFRDKVESYQL